jgi:hypothetical protein
MKPKDKPPPPCYEQRVRDLLAHYESQSEEGAVAEYEATLEHRSTSMVKLPNDRLPAVRELLAKPLPKPF